MSAFLLPKSPRLLPIFVKVVFDLYQRQADLAYSRGDIDGGDRILGEAVSLINEVKDLVDIEKCVSLPSQRK